MATKYTDVTLSPPAGGGTLTYDGTDANERILFTDPHDTGFGDLVIDLGGGDDLIPAARAGSSVYFGDVDAEGGAGDDSISLVSFGTGAADGGAGNDTIRLVADGSATVHGGAGDDHISAINDDTGSGAAFGGAGNDVIYAEGDGEGGGAAADGGAGNDRITLHGANMTADGGAGNDLLTSDNDGELIEAHGGAGNDRLVFGSTDLDLFGDAGDDTISGRVDSTDDQFLYGGTGNDTIRYALGAADDAGATVGLYGGAGRDQLYAGGAHDVLHVEAANTPAGAGRDVVHGFESGQDHIALDGDADVTKAGTQHYAFAGVTTHPGAGQVGYHRQGGDTIVEGFDGKTHFEVRLQGFHGALDAGDFIA